MTREEKDQYQQISRKCRFCLAGSLGLVLALALTRMVLSNRPATWGGDLNELKQTVAEVKNQNFHLTTELAAKSGNLIDIQAAALAAGYTDKPQIKTLAVPAAVAQALP